MGWWHGGKVYTGRAFGASGDGGCVLLGDGPALELARTTGRRVIVADEVDDDSVLSLVRWISNGEDDQGLVYESSGGGWKVKTDEKEEKEVEAKKEGEKEEGKKEEEGNKKDKKEEKSAPQDKEKKDEKDEKDKKDDKDEKEKKKVEPWKPKYKVGDEVSHSSTLTMITAVLHETRSYELCADTSIPMSPPPPPEQEEEGKQEEGDGEEDKKKGVGENEVNPSFTLPSITHLL